MIAGERIHFSGVGLSVEEKLEMKKTEERLLAIQQHEDRNNAELNKM